MFVRRPRSLASEKNETKLFGATAWIFQTLLEAGCSQGGHWVVDQSRAVFALLG